MALATNQIIFREITDVDRIMSEKFKSTEIVEIMDVLIENCDQVNNRH